MNVFNRVFAIVCLLGLIVVLILGILQPVGAIDGLRHLLDTLRAFIDVNLAIYWAVAAGLLFVAILLLLLELRRPRRLTVRVRQAGGGVVELTTESVARSLEYHVGQLPGVTKVRPEVTSRGDSVRVFLDLETDPALDVPAKSEEVIQLAHEVVEGKLGIRLAPVRVSIRQAPYGPQSHAAPRRDLPGSFPTEGSLPLA